MITNRFLVYQTTLAALLWVGAAEAQEPPPETPPTPAPPEAPVEPPREAPPAPEPPVSKGPSISGAPGKGVTLLVDDKFSLNIRTRFQIRATYQALPEDPKTKRVEHESLLNINTARIYFTGHAYKPELQYVIQLAVAGRDYRDGATSPIFDAFFDWQAHRDFNVKAGQYFVPFDRLRSVREFALQMADRPVPVSELTLDRDTGVTLYSRKLFDSPLAYHLSAFGGGGTNQVAGKDAGGMFVGRLELRPLGPIDDDSEGDLDRRKDPGLAIGVGFANNWNTNRVRGTTGATYKGGRTDYMHAAADLVFKGWGFALQAEYLYRKASTDKIQSLDETVKPAAPLTEWTRSAHGWVLQSSYVFDPPIEIVGRLTRMHTLSGTDPKLILEVDKRGTEVGAGLNYYFNGHKLKLQTDWIARMPDNFHFGSADHVVHLLLDATL